MATSFSTAAARPPPHLLLLPYPTEGHLLPLLDLSVLLHARGITTTVVLTTPTAALTTIPPGVHFAVLRPSSTASEDAKSRFPQRTPTFFHTMHGLAALHDPALEWARSHPSPPDAVVSDMFLGSWTTRLAEELGIPRLVFCPSGALALSATNFLWREMPTPAADDGGDDTRGTVTFSSLPGSPSMPWSQISTVYQKYIEHAGAAGGTLEFVREGFLANIASWGFVFNTFEDLERPYLEHMKRELGHRRVWAVGPVTGRQNPAPLGGELRLFLDSSPNRSVVYVSFGSQTTLTPVQGAALAAALERSGVRFVWCARGEGSVPEGFEERTEGRGVVVKGWSPQRAALSHKAIASFVTHCGWNSVMEAAASGVVMVAWPQRADQFYNARLVVEELGVGVWGWRAGGDSAPDPDGLGRVIAESLDPSRVERRKADELRRGADAAVLEGGSSDGDLEGMLLEISKVNKIRLFQKNNGI